MVERESLTKYVAYPILAVVAVAFLPIVVPAAVSRNYRGIADRLSMVPGIRRGGGSTAALATLVYLTVGTVLLLGTASASLGSAPFAGGTGGGVSTPESTTTATALDTAKPTTDSPAVVTTETYAMPTPTPTPTPTATPTPTPTESPEQEMARFKTIFRQSINYEKLVDVPIVAMSAREDGRLILLYDAVSVNKNDTKMRQQWYAITLAYGAAIHRFTRYNNSGRAPWRLKVISWNETEVGPDGAFHVDTVDAQRHLNDELSLYEYNVRWFTTIHAVNNDERGLAWNIFENKTGRQVSRNATLPENETAD